MSLVLKLYILLLKPFFVKKGIFDLTLKFISLICTAKSEETVTQHKESNK